MNIEKIINWELFELQDKTLFYTYKHFTLDDKEIFYVGKGKNKRCLDIADRNLWWNNIVNKHNYYIEIDQINLSEKEALQREKDLITQFGRRELGGKLVNLTDGGEGVSGYIYSDERKQQISEYFKAHPELQEIGNRYLYFGQQLYGEDNPNYGNRGSKNPLSKKVVKVSLEGTLIETYDSIKEAAKENNVYTSSISSVCLKKRHQLKGYVYMFLKDYEEGTYDISLGVTNKKPVYQLDKDTLEIIKEYSSVSETKIDNFNPRNVSQVCCKNKKTHKGFKWMFKSEYTKQN